MIKEPYNPYDHFDKDISKLPPIQEPKVSACVLGEIMKQTGMMLFGSGSPEPKMPDQPIPERILAKMGLLGTGDPIGTIERKRRRTGMTTTLLPLPSDYVRISDLKFMGNHDKNITTQVVINCPTCGSNSFTKGFTSKKCNHCGSEIEIPLVEDIVKPLNLQQVEIKRSVLAHAGKTGPYVAAGAGQLVAVELFVEDPADQNKINVGWRGYTNAFVEFRVMSTGGVFCYLRPIDPMITMSIQSEEMLTFTQ